MHFLLYLPTALACLLVTVSAGLVTLLGLFCIRRKFDAERLKENHEVAAIIFNAFGWLYAVIVAFVVFVTWTGYDEANKNLQLEASETLDFFYTADAFASPLREDVRHRLVDYAQYVAGEELPQMSDENMPLYSAPALRQLRQFVYGASSSTVRNPELYGATLRELERLMEYRRLRIFAGRNSVPDLIWLLLLLGSLITVGNTYLFGMKHLWVQACLVAALAMTLSLILFLIYVLDHPFTGANRVSEAPLQEAITIMKMNQAAAVPGH